MPLHKAFGVDLGSSMVKIYSQSQDTIIAEKNMIAVRNQNQVLAVGNDAYEIFEKNPSNVSVISPVLGGKIADIHHTEMVLQALLKKADAQALLGCSLYLAIPSDLSEIDKRAYYTIGNSNRKNKIYMVDKTIADAVALGLCGELGRGKSWRQKNISRAACAAKILQTRQRGTAAGQKGPGAAAPADFRPFPPVERGPPEA